MATTSTPGQETLFPRWLVLIEGILAIFVGFMFVFWPIRSFATLVFFLGFWWLMDGVLDIVSIIVDRRNWGWKLVMGAIGVLAGLFLVLAPLQGALALSETFTLVVGFLGVLYGIIGIINAFRVGSLGGGILATISILLGIYIISNLWVAALALPWLFGIFAIAGGVAAIFLAFRSRQPARL